MLTYKELQEKGICWTGYKRKKGTKPYEEGSCVKEELEQHHALAFGRMNPITSGHEAVVNKLHSVAKEHGASHNLIVSHSQDAKKNPLTAEQKVKHAKNAFPGTNVTAASKESPTILHHAAAAHAAGATHLHVIAGSDRHEEMHNLLHKYNGKDSSHGHYNFKKITVHSSGERDPDAEGTTGISASKMREHAASGNKEAFHAGAPSKMKPEHKDAMYNDVRKGMNLKEQAPVAPVPDRKYIKGTPEWKAHKEKSKPINGHPTNVKEETTDQQADRTMQLKRFKNQMTKLNGPNVDTEIPLDKKEKDIMTGKVKPKNKTELGLSKQEQDNLADVNEHLTAAAGAGAWINDFISSTNPRFNNKSKAERRKMAIGAYMAAKAKGVQEATLQGNVDGGDAMNTTTSAPPTKVPQGGVKKIKGFKFFNGTNEPNTQMTVKEEKKDDVPFDGPYKSTFKKPNNPNRTGMDAARSLAQRAMDQLNKKKPVKEQFETEFTVLEEAAKAIDSGEYDYEGQMARTQLQTTLRNCQDLIGMIEDDENMPEWVQSKITLAQDYITTVRDYLQSKEELGEETLDEQDIGKHNNATTGFKPLVNKLTPKYGEEVAGKIAGSIKKKIMAKEEVEQIEERNKANALMRKTMDASRGAKFKLKNPVPDANPKHKTARDHNVAIGRALRNEAATGNPGGGYHGACGTADDMYNDMHKHVKNLTDADDKTVKHYLDSGHGEKLAGREQDHDHIKADFKKFMKYYRPEMHDPKPAVKEETAPVGKPQKITLKTAVIKLHPNGVASDTEEGWAKPKKIKEESMKSYKEFLQSLHEKLIGKQKKLDKNHNNKLDAQDFKMLRKEEVELDESTYPSAEQAKNVVAALKQKHNDGNYSVKQTKNGHKVVHAYDSDAKVKTACKSVNEEAEQLDEYETDANGVYRHTKKATYGTSYVDPEGADETAADLKKKEKKTAGRKTGKTTGSYKPRATMSKLKQLGATYK